MKGVMLDVPDYLLEQRRISGADQWDEVWEGVLHMVPPPSVSHQDWEWKLETWLRVHWLPTQPGNRVFHQVALSPLENWIHDYRTPDIVIFTSEHLGNLRLTFCQGPCTVAVEIRSSGDETYEKLEFYARLGVPEVWITDRDSQRPEIHALRDGRYESTEPSADGWLSSSAVAVRFKHDSHTLTLQVPGLDQSIETLS